MTSIQPCDVREILFLVWRTPAAIWFVCCLLSGCCGNFQLVTFGKHDEKPPNELIWRKEREARLPQNQLEESVVNVAVNHQTAREGNALVIYVTHENADTLVAVVEEVTKSRLRFEPKKVLRYIVEDGKIKATMGPSIEPFPDVTLERLTLVAVQKATTEGGWSVVPVLNWVEPVAVKAIVKGRCNVEVKYFEMTSGSPGKQICSKSMNPCPL